MLEPFFCVVVFDLGCAASGLRLMVLVGCGRCGPAAAAPAVLDWIF